MIDTSEEARPRVADELASARALFAPEAGSVYLDTATYGLPPRPTVDALERAISAWQAGSAAWIDDWDRPTDSSRADFAALIGAETEEIASISASSVAAGLVAEALSAGDEVVVPADEFTSTLYPLLVAAEDGVVVHEVDLAELAGAVTERTSLVAFSLVQMQTGRVADLAAIIEAARRHDARVFVDATQAVPFADLASHISDIDYLACSAYKHLLSPRGVAFMYVRRDRWSSLRPLLANWRAADDPFGRYFGGPLQLAPDARRFDISRAWFPWIGAAESLRLLAGWQRDGLLEVVRQRAADLAERLELPWHGSTLICPPIDDAPAVSAALAAAGIRASVRGTAVRLAPHVYTTEEDIERTVEVLRPLLAADG